MGWLDRILSRFSAQPEPAVQARVEQRVTFPSHPLSYPDDVYRIPVLLVSYFPSKDGQISKAVTGDIEGSLGGLRRKTREDTRRIAEALELGSIYHGYKDSHALPSLRYEFVGNIEFLEPLPTWPKPGHRVPMVDYNAIMERIDVRSWVEEHGVKEVWLWGYHGGVVDLWESNMAGPHGDVSNSDRDPGDLPVFGQTYTVFHYNYGRGAPEAVEDHMHQLEAIFRETDPTLFWDKFVGKPGEGRCGWAHFPPNAARDYDWANKRFIATDIEDWQPEGGPRLELNCERWGADSLTWFIYWMQNVPGRNNRVSHHGHPCTNWWTFVGDWDGARTQGLGLVER